MSLGELPRRLDEFGGVLEQFDDILPLFDGIEYLRVFASSFQRDALDLPPALLHARDGFLRMCTSTPDAELLVAGRFPFASRAGGWGDQVSLFLLDFPAVSTGEFAVTLPPRSRRTEHRRRFTVSSRGDARCEPG